MAHVYTVHCANGIGEQHLCKVMYIYILYITIRYFAQILLTNTICTMHGVRTHAPHQGLYHTCIRICTVQLLGIMTCHITHV